MKKINTQRVLLITLVAVAFFGFLLWSIRQSQSEEESLYNSSSDINISTENKVVKVTSPKIGAQIKNPALIAGQANLSGNKLKAKIKDNKGLILAESFVQVKNVKKMSDFSISLTYKKPSTLKGVVEVFQVAAKDDSEINKIIIPIVFED
jgi:hypothetical protein